MIHTATRDFTYGTDEEVKACSPRAFFFLVAFTSTHSNSITINTIITITPATAPTITTEKACDKHV